MKYVPVGTGVLDGPKATDKTEFDLFKLSLCSCNRVKNA